MRVVIAEDEALLRQGLALVLEQDGFEVVSAVGTAAELEDAVGEHQPQLVITDIRMPPTFTDEGLVAAHALEHGRLGARPRGRAPGLRALGLALGLGLAAALRAGRCEGRLLGEHAAPPRRALRVALRVSARTLRAAAGGGRHSPARR